MRRVTDWKIPHPLSAYAELNMEILHGKHCYGTPRKAVGCPHHKLNYMGNAYGYSKTGVMTERGKIKEIERGNFMDGNEIIKDIFDDETPEFMIALQGDGITVKEFEKQYKEEFERRKNGTKI